MRVHRSRMRRLMGRKPGSKSPDLKSGAAEPTMRSTGISCTPPNERPSNPAARSKGSIDRSRWAWPVRIVSRLRRNARARAESKSWIARMRSIPLTVTRSQIVFLKKRFLGFSVEEVHPAGVEAELDAVPRRHAHARVDPGRDLVAPDLPIEELVRAEPLDHVDFHVAGRRAVGYAVGDRPQPAPRPA